MWLLLQVVLQDMAHAQAGDFVQILSGSINGRNSIKLEFEIKKGYHIQSHQPGGENLIPTELEIEWPGGISQYQQKFSEPHFFTLEGADDVLSVFSEQLVIEIIIEIVDGMEMPEQLKGNLRYQACDRVKCFFPRTFPFTISLEHRKDSG